MSHSPTLHSQPRTEQHISDDEAVDSLLAALEDEDCRAILEATSEATLSASELSEACDLPLSTTYRKIDKLSDADLLAEHIRLSSSGKHTSEYTLGIESIELSVDADEGVALQLSHCSDADTGGSLLAAGD